MSHKESENLKSPSDRSGQEKVENTKTLQKPSEEQARSNFFFKERFSFFNLKYQAKKMKEEEQGNFIK